MGVYFIGDLHGTAKPIEKFCRGKINDGYSFGKEEVLVCLGDFGANYYLNNKDSFFKKKLGKFPFTYFVIRGNHEQRPSILAEEKPELWTTEEYFGNTVYVEKEFPYIKYALDIAAVYNIYGFKTLTLPGAYSVDKWYRLQNDWSWFPQEQMSQEEMEECTELIKNNDSSFDLILSHTCPINLVPTDLFLSSIDQNMVDNTMERYFGHIEYTTKYKCWCWGHYHDFRIYPSKIGIPSFDNPRKVMFDWLNVMELNELMNTR